jgi:hypothetical protein
MANLLAYRALALFPSAPARRGLLVTGWQRGKEDGEYFTWPLWAVPLGPDSVRSLLLSPELARPDPGRAALTAMGVEAVFRAHRIKVGSGAKFKWNFTPARQV